MRIIHWATLATLACTLAVPVLAQQEDRLIPPRPAPAVVAPKPLVQIAILLDTSNSMDGLIEQAKAQLWKIVNEFAKSQANGKHPDIQVALYQYGTPSLGIENNYIKQLVPLTDDLDKVSEELFKLRTDGGDEYCGAVIQKAARDLKWSRDKSAYKAIFIAGNEPFTQGGISYKESCKEAIAQGIIINTIFCGDQQEGVNTFWKDGAMLADGAYMSINQDAAVVQVTAPQDKEIAELGAKINKTYVGYGAGGRGGAANQMAQDSNAAHAGGGRGPAGAPSAAEVERSVTKAQSVYHNSTWDLVDAVSEGKVALKDLKEEDLPEEMRKLDAKGRADYIAAKVKERAEIQARIKQLSTDRDQYLAQKRKESGDKTLDTAVLDAVHAQAKNNGLAFPDAPR